MVSYYYVTVLHLFGYSVNGHFSIRVRVRVWYYFIFRDRYMEYSNGLPRGAGLRKKRLRTQITSSSDISSTITIFMRPQMTSQRA